MRKEIGKKCVCAGVLLGLSMNLLAGCKEKTVDYRMESVTEGTTESAQGEKGKSNTAGRGKKGLKQFEEMKQWDESWKYVDEKGEECGGFMDVYISVPDAEQMSVVEVKELEINTTYKKQLTESIFHDSEIYYGDVKYLPKKELEERRKRCEYMQQLDMGDGTDWEKEQSIYEEALKTAGETYMLADKYDAAAYLGTYAGTSYELSFLEYEMGEVPNKLKEYQRMPNEHPFVKSDGIENKAGFVICCRCKEIFFTARDLYQFCPEEVKEVENLNYKPLDLNSKNENKCKLSEEEAREQAERFIDELKLEYPVYVYSKPLGWWNGMDTGNDEADYVADGYVLFFDAGIDSMSFTRYGTQETDRFFSDKKEGAEEIQYSMNARLEVYINDKGIVGMRAQNPIEMLGKSEGVELLPIKEIQEIIKGEIELGSSKSYTGTNDKMELIYLRIRDKEQEGYFSYVPAWRLSEVWFTDVGGYPIGYSNQLLINAIDGSVIDFYDEA